MKTIVIGVGNPILKDDAVGIHVARELKKFVKDSNIEIDEAYTGGMNLLDLILGFDKAIIADSFIGEKEGEIRKLTINDISSSRSLNPHGLTLIESLEMAKRLGETKIPKEIIFYVIILNEYPSEFGEELSAKVGSAIPKAVKMILEELSNKK